MAFDFVCPYCHLKTLVDDQFAGKTGPCASCGKTVQMPRRGSSEELNGSEETDADAEARLNLKKQQSASWRNIIVMRTVVAVGCVIGLVTIGILFLQPALEIAISKQREARCRSNLIQIIEALKTYRVENGGFPPAYVSDKNGKPLYSWRVLILPQLGYQDIYDEYILDQPWDSPANASLISRMPAVYASPGSVDAETLHETNYVLLTGPGTMYPMAGPKDPDSITDRPGETLLVCETGNSGQNWTQPVDLKSRGSFTLGNKPFKTIGGNHRDVANAAAVDGTIYCLPNDINPVMLDALITPDGGESINPEELQVETLQ